MNIQVKKHPEPVLKPEDFEEFTSIRNPGAIRFKDKIILLVTVRHKDRTSKLYIAKSKNGKKFELEQTPFIDNDENSTLGVEDARITKIDNEYFITFTAFKAHTTDHNITRISLVKTKDFKTYYDRDIILEEFDNNKDGVLFKNKKTYLMHRPSNSNLYPSKTPGARIATTKDFQEFKDLGEFLSPRKDSWDNARVGANTPPIRIKHKEFGECYLMLYHGTSKDKNIYRIGYVVLDKDNPMKILERSEKPLLSPELLWEKKGEVNNVIFGCGLIPASKNTLRFFYAGADKSTGLADLILEDAEIILKEGL